VIRNVSGSDPAAEMAAPGNRCEVGRALTGTRSPGSRVGVRVGCRVVVDGIDKGAAVGFMLTEGYFSTEQEALAEIADRGWHSVAFDVPAEQNDLHWHDFDSVVFIVDGTARVEFEDGSAMECGAGARIEAPSRVLHREASSAYRAVFGFSVDPADMTQPVNKPVVERT